MPDAQLEREPTQFWHLLFQEGPPQFPVSSLLDTDRAQELLALMTGVTWLKHLM